MRNVFEYYDEKDHLEHHGILGMKWGIRRYQNKDGSLTEAGKARYLSANGEFNYAARNFDSKKGAKIYKNYRAYEEKEALKDISLVAKMPTKTIAQRKEKAKKERELLVGWDDDQKDPDYGRKLARGVAIQHLIERNGFDWYNSNPVLQEAREPLERLRSNIRDFIANRRITTLAEFDKKNEIEYSKLDQIALKVIGFEDTPENRKLIRNYYVTD